MRATRTSRPIAGGTVALILGLLAALLLPATATYAQSDETAGDTPSTATDLLTEARERGTLRIVVHPTFDPFATRSARTNEVVGFDREFGDALADAIGLRAEWIVAETRDDVRNLLIRAEADVALASGPPIESMNVAAASTPPYAEVGARVAVLRGSDAGAARMPRELNVDGTTIGAVVDSASKEAAVEFFDVANVRSVGTPVEGIQELLDGTIDALAFEGPWLESFSRLNRDKEIVVLQEPMAAWPSRVYVQHNQPALLEECADAVARLEANGTLQQLRGTYLQADDWREQHGLKLPYNAAQISDQVAAIGTVLAIVGAALAVVVFIIIIIVFHRLNSKQEKELEEKHRAEEAGSGGNGTTVTL